MLGLCYDETYGAMTNHDDRDDDGDNDGNEDNKASSRSGFDGLIFDPITTPRSRLGLAEEDQVTMTMDMRPRRPMYLRVGIYLPGRRPYVRMSYRPPFVGKQGGALQSSSPCDLPPHKPATKRPCRGQIQKIPPFWDRKRLQSSVPCHLVGSANCHRVFPQKLPRRLRYGAMILLRKHLGMIPLILLIPDATDLAWNLPQRGHLRLTTICQLRRPTKPDPVAPFGDLRLLLLPLPSDGNRDSQPAPWSTPL